MRFKIFSLALFLVATFFAAPVSSFAETNSQSAASEIKILSFNIRYGSADDGENSWPLRKEMVTEVIKSGNYDFVGLQECLIHPDSDKNQLEYLKKELGDKYGSVARCREKDPTQGEASAIFYNSDRWELDADETGTFWLAESPDEPGMKSWETACTRVVTWGRFTDKTTKKSVYFYNTHFDHVSKLAQDHSAIMVIEHIAQRKHKSDSVFLTGDFNCGEKSMPIRYLSGNSITFEGKTYPAHTYLKDSFRELFSDVIEQPTFHAFKGTPTMKVKIDFIFASPNVKTLSTEILKTNKDGKYPSDHFPITATFEVK